MWSEREYLKTCDNVHKLGLRPRFEPGEIVARGFADLGFEEFLILPSKKLLSVMTGNIAELADGDRDRLVFVPGVEQLVEILEERKCFLERIEFVDGVRWVGLARFLEEQISCESKSLKACLMNLVLKSFGKDAPRSKNP